MYQLLFLGMEKLETVIFYTIEKAIKTYRQFAQRNISKAGLDITIDQWLVLRLIDEDGEQYQNEIAEAVFKDTASITRIVELLVLKGYLKRNEHPGDRRRFKLNVTDKGRDLLAKVSPIVTNYRDTALQGISPSEIQALQQVLNRIITNCS
jgi:MarR family transcriptional regulator for hemolysin